jgi:hypothetical protein
MRISPKEKAKELIYRFSASLKVFDELEGWIIHVDSSKAKKYALVAVDICIELHFNLESDVNGIGDSFKYWLEVKQEIEKYYDTKRRSKRIS